MKNLFTYLDNLSGEAILLLIIIIAYLYLALWARKNLRSSKRDERNARDRYQVTEELDEQIRRRKK